MSKNIKYDLIFLLSTLTAALLIYLFKGVVILDYVMVILSIYVIFTSLLEIKKEKFNAVTLIVIAIFVLYSLLLK